MMPTTQPSESSSVVDTDEMVLIHTFLRREFRLAAGVLRRVRPGDTARAADVADHLDFLDRFLHHHHTIEDELLWPVLLERVPEELAPIVHLMETQHAGVEGTLATIGELLPRWRATADAGLGERLAGEYDVLYVALAEHLDAEEQRLLPIAARRPLPGRVGRTRRGGTQPRQPPRGTAGARDVRLRGRPGGLHPDARRRPPPGPGRADPARIAVPSASTHG